jgi:hypothetical protein
VLLRWSIQRGCGVVASSSSPAHIQSNADVLDWSLDAAAMAALGSGGRLPQIRYYSPTVEDRPDARYATVGEFWDDADDPSMNHFNVVRDGKQKNKN